MSYSGLPSAGKRKYEYYREVCRCHILDSRRVFLGSRRSMVGSEGACVVSLGAAHMVGAAAYEAGMGKPWGAYGVVI